MGWHLLPHFGPSQILLVSVWGQHPIPYRDPPVVRQLMQVVITLPGQGRWFSSAVPVHSDEHSLLSRVDAEAEQSSRLCQQFQRQLVGSPFSCGMKPVLVGLVAQSRPIAHQALLSMGFSRQEYWSGLPFPSPGDLPNLGIEPGSPALQADSLPSEPPGKPIWDEVKGLNCQVCLRSY